MTESTVGMWHDYAWAAGSPITPASFTGVLALGFVPISTMGDGYGQFTIPGANVTFTAVDLTEIAESPNNTTSYRGGIQSVDKSFSANPILIAIPQEFSTGYDINYIESAVITIAGVWFDGLIISGRDAILEDLRTSKHWVNPMYYQSPFVLLLSNRAYFVYITGYSSNIVGGQGGVISFRLGLSICSIKGHYGN